MSVIGQFEVVNQVLGVWELWFIPEEYPYSWEFVGQFDSEQAAHDEMNALIGVFEAL